MKILTVFGTRPEAIKMAPLVREMQAASDIKNSVCVTGQHRQMLDQVLKFFDIKPEYDLDVMTAEQSPLSVTSAILSRMEPVLKKCKPDMVLVHGDTATSFAATLAAYYSHIDVGHVEAGLRTGNMDSPWPEEGNRRLTGALARLHFAPTQRSMKNLLNEGVPPSSIFVTGNTVIDALLAVKAKIEGDAIFMRSLSSLFGFLRKDARLVLITGHRRENFGEGFENICAAIKELSLEFPDVDFLYPVHLNPNVSRPVRRILHGLSNVHLIEPQEYLPFVHLMMRAHIILTDSGGVQEEAPALGKPVLVMRDATERPEAIRAGTAKLVGSNKDAVVAGVRRLLVNEAEHQLMAQAHNPYGDGKASQYILQALRKYSNRAFLPLEGSVFPAFSAHFAHPEGAIAADASGGAPLQHAASVKSSSSEKKARLEALP